MAKRKKNLNDTAATSESPGPVRVVTYTITDDAIPQDGSSPAEDAALQESYTLTHNDPKKAIEVLKTLIKLYPNNPRFLNHLVCAYVRIEDKESAYAIAEAAYKQFPDYLFARVNFAHYRLTSGDTKAVEAIFDKGFDLSVIIPGRTIFHESEALAVFGLAALCYHKLGNAEQANIFLGIIKEIDPEHPVVMHIMVSRIENWTKKLQNRTMRKKRKPNSVKQSLVKQTVADEEIR